MKLRMLLDTFARNYRHTQWPITVLDPFEDAATIVEKALKEKAAIDADPHLTPEGKTSARLKAGKSAIAAIAQWHAPRLAGLDADLGVHRAALLPTGEKPDARKIDVMLGILQKHTPEEIARFYDKATDDERLVMEAASASVGRIPTKTANGLHWAPLLNPETVNESVMARAAHANPQGAQKLTELAEIRSAHVTVAGHAVAEIREAMNLQPEPVLTMHTS